MLGYQPSPVSVPAPPTWGGMSPGMKTVLKVLFVAAVAATVGYVAVDALLGVPQVASTVSSLGSMLAGFGETVLSGLNAAIVFLGGSPLGVVTLSEGAASGIATVAGATSAVVAGAAAMPAVKTTALSSLASDSVAAPASKVPDLSAQTQAIDPAILSNKNTLAMADPNAAGHTASKAASMMDIPDSALAAHQQQQSAHHTADTSKTAKIGHMGEEIKAERRHAASTRDHLDKVHSKLADWKDRVAGNASARAHQEPSVASSYASRLPKKDSSHGFADAVDADRERLTQVLGTRV